MTLRYDREVIDKLYAVAVEPERFRELVDIWMNLISSVDEGTYDEGLSFLEQHIGRAERILSIVDDSHQLLPKPIQERLDEDPQAAVAISKENILIAVNEAGRQAFGVNIGDSVNRLPFSADALSTIADEAKRLRDEVIKNAQVLPGVFQVLRDTGESTPEIISLSGCRSPGERVFVILKSIRYVWPDYLTDIVEAAFGLTKAESEVMRFFVEGNSLESIAETRGTSINTVRSQIRAIYDKTSTNNQAEFVRLAIGLSAMSLTDRDVITGAFQRLRSVTEPAYPLPEHIHMQSLPDGRVLEYADFGPRNGLAVIHFHNEYYGNIWPAKAAKLALENGFRIIAPARPYYGNSSPYPKDAETFSQFAEDLACLLDRLGVKKSVLLCQTMGAKFMIEFALKNPDRVKAFVSIAPAVPMVNDDDVEGMAKYPRFVAKLVYRNHSLLKFISKSGLFYHNRVGSVQFLRTMICQTEPDIKVTEDPNNLDAIIRGFEFSGRQGYRSFYFDHKDSPQYELERLMSPTQKSYYIIGSEDPNNRSHRTDKLIATGANVEKVIADGGGEILLYSHPGVVVNTISRAWDEN